MAGWVQREVGGEAAELAHVGEGDGEGAEGELSFFGQPSDHLKREVAS